MPGACQGGTQESYWTLVYQTDYEVSERGRTETSEHRTKHDEIRLQNEYLLKGTGRWHKFGFRDGKGRRVWGASKVLKQRINAPEREGIVMATTSQRKSERPAENGGVMVVGVGSQPRHAPQGHSRHRQAHVDPLPEGALRRESCT